MAIEDEATVTPVEETKPFAEDELSITLGQVELEFHVECYNMDEVVKAVHRIAVEFFKGRPYKVNLHVNRRNAEGQYQYQSVTFNAHVRCWIPREDHY